VRVCVCACVRVCVCACVRVCGCREWGCALTAPLEASAVESINREKDVAPPEHHIRRNQSPPDEVHVGILDLIEELADGLAREAGRLTSSLPRHRVITLAGQLLGL
jgi:hypothetical protein